MLSALYTELHPLHETQNIFAHTQSLTMTLQYKLAVACTPHASLTWIDEAG